MVRRNTTALQSLVKGISKSLILSRIVEYIHIIMYRIKADIYFKYVRSADNWSDGVSRVGFDDDIVRRLRYAGSNAAGRQLVVPVAAGHLEQNC